MAQVLTAESIIPNRRLLLRGMGASLGRASGVVKVALTLREAESKMADGDILVVPMTGPDWLRYLQKAAAVITDHGGVLSHAAIVCREYGIPCVVGTKVGSKILKDGMRVEVEIRGAEGLVYG